MRKRSLVSRSAIGSLLGVLILAGSAPATTLRREATLVDLMGQSELILQGRVENLTDGFDERGIPYTEVTVRVSEAIKGLASGSYTFRQFGLLKPRPVGDGRVSLMVTPPGWPTYEKGENTILFLRKSAAWTGLRTTAGLAQGKFSVRMANAANRTNNAGLFRGVEVDPALVGDAQKRVLATREGSVNARAFVALVRQAVAEQWVEKGRMRNAQK